MEGPFGRRHEDVDPKVECRQRRRKQPQCEEPPPPFPHPIRFIVVLRAKSNRLAHLFAQETADPVDLVVQLAAFGGKLSFLVLGTSFEKLASRSCSFTRCAETARSSSRSCTSFALNSASSTPLALPARGRHNPLKMSSSDLPDLDQIAMQLVQLRHRSRTWRGRRAHRGAALTSSRPTTRRRRSTICAPRMRRSGRDRRARGADPAAAPPSGGAVAWRPRGDPGAGGAHSDALSSSRSPNGPGSSSTSGVRAGSGFAAQRCAPPARGARAGARPVRPRSGPLPTPWYLRWGASGAAIVVLLATVGALVGPGGRSRPGRGARRRRRRRDAGRHARLVLDRDRPPGSPRGVDRRHPNEGSSGDGEGR